MPALPPTMALLGYTPKGRKKACGAAHAVVEAGLAGKYLGQRAVYDEAYGQLFRVLGWAELFHGTEGRAAEKALHNLHQLCVGELFDAGKAFCQDLTVAAVTAEGEVIPPQQEGLTHGGSLLTEREVRRAGIGRLHAVVHTLGLYLIEHRLKLTQNGDVPPDADELRVRKAGALLRHGPVVSVHGDVPELYHARGAQLRRVHKDAFWHCYLSLIS